mmetsp:Transcript_26064/g.62009  ORF Transcript_26064/g.62009 Transcript_26064/m.62009 type:complete len:213 (-) Transcript_26064:953-1591(-)
MALQNGGDCRARHTSSLLVLPQSEESPLPSSRETRGRTERDLVNVCVRWICRSRRRSRATSLRQNSRSALIMSDMSTSTSVAQLSSERECSSYSSSRLPSTRSSSSPLKLTLFSAPGGRPLLAGGFSLCGLSGTSARGLVPPPPPASCGSAAAAASSRAMPPPPSAQPEDCSPAPAPLVARRRSLRRPTSVSTWYISTVALTRSRNTSFVRL